MKVLFFLSLFLLLVGCSNKGSKYGATNGGKYGATTSSMCIVKDKDISSYYSGGCMNGLANGFGVATGKDEYRGYFRDGWQDGSGTYIWKEGITYTGKWKGGKRNGLGKLVMSQNSWNTSRDYARSHPNATLMGDSFVEDGLFENDNFVQDRTSFLNQTNVAKKETESPKTNDTCKSVKQTHTVFSGVNKQANKMIRSGNMGDKLYGGFLKLMFGAIPSGVEQGNPDCYPK